MRSIASTENREFLCLEARLVEARPVWARLLVSCFQAGASRSLSRGMGLEFAPLFWRNPEKEGVSGHAAGNKKFPCVKAMDWTGKTATAQVIRGFVKSTPVVEQCALPRCISRLVIAPKYAPGQMKDDPDHGFRVCVNALINKCLKPYASTVPLATDEIKNCMDSITTSK